MKRLLIASLFITSLATATNKTFFKMQEELTEKQASETLRNKYSSTAVDQIEFRFTIKKTEECTMEEWNSMTIKASEFATKQPNLNNSDEFNFDDFIELQEYMFDKTIENNLNGNISIQFSENELKDKTKRIFIKK